MASSLGVPGVVCVLDGSSASLRFQVLVSASGGLETSQFRKDRRVRKAMRRSSGRRHQLVQPQFQGEWAALSIRRRVSARTTSTDV